MFDFGLLNSPKSRGIFVAEVAKLAPPLTARDYDLSLQAAFPIDLVFAAAKEELPRPFRASASAFVDFCYFLQTPRRTQPSAEARAYIRGIWRRLSATMKAEHLLLRWLRRVATVS